MTAGQLFKDELLFAQFGESRVLETARKLKEIWPDGFPEGREEITHFQAAYFLYILCSTEGPKDVAIGLERSTNYYSREDGGIPVTALGKIINDVPHGLVRVEISQRTGFMDVLYRDGKPAYYPGKGERLEMQPESGSKQIQDLLATVQRLELELNNVSGPTQDILRQTIDRYNRRIELFNNAREKWFQKYKLASSESLDIITVLKPSFLKNFSKKLK